MKSSWLFHSKDLPISENSLIVRILLHAQKLQMINYKRVKNNKEQIKQALDNKFYGLKGIISINFFIWIKTLKTSKKQIQQADTINKFNYQHLENQQLNQFALQIKASNQAIKNHIQQNKSMKLRRRELNHSNYNTVSHQENIVKKYKTTDSMVTINHPEKKLRSEGSRLRRMTHKTQKGSQSQNPQKTSPPQLINANSFKHFLQVAYINQNYLKWAFGLREHQPAKIKRTASQIPSTYYKTIEAYKTHHEVNEIPAKINFSEVQHLARHGQHPSTGTLRFQTTLRGTEEVTEELEKRQKKFSLIPAKQRNEYPKLLASKSLKKKQITSADTQSALDGANNYPSFTQKIVRQRNFNNIRQMTRGKVNLPSIGWQTGLRFY